MQRSGHNGFGKCTGAQRPAMGGQVRRQHTNSLQAAADKPSMNTDFPVPAMQQDTTVFRIRCNCCGVQTHNSEVSHLRRIGVDHVLHHQNSSPCDRHIIPASRKQKKKKKPISPLAPPAASMAASFCDKNGFGAACKNSFEVVFAVSVGARIFPNPEQQSESAFGVRTSHMCPTFLLKRTRKAIDNVQY